MLPTFKSWSAREVVTSEKLNEQIRDVYSFISNAPSMVCKRTTTLKITGGSAEKVPWETAEGSGITVNKSGSSIPSLTISQAGLYYATASLAGQPSDVTHFMIDICVNGSRELRGVTTADQVGYQDTALCAGTLRLKAGDIITTEVYVSQGRTAVFTDTSWQVASSALQLCWKGVY
ncbi:hypothetical protein [Streptomyces noursei]|uniref:hypothetical protein n=1 Tax=Streptomyces noursei TaxID=1971 RepID=UPI001679A61D|nr:hypothetical protein [Streptomyces noursei]MCZ1015620.1 hypothetical protein [Streptomyces noursei]GGW89512.1 hypothetical protein GCM10010341_07930 [Streptomyces noursei]